MAEQIFPYHLAGFAMGALATGYSISSLKQYLTRPVNSIEATTVDPSIPPPSHTRKRKRDPDVTSLPPTKRRAPDTINTSSATNRSVECDDLNTPSPIRSVKITSNSEQGSVEVTIGDVSSHSAYSVKTKSHYDVKISFRERKHHSKCNDSYAAFSSRNNKATTDVGVSTSGNVADEEDFHSDRTMIGDDLEDHDDGSDESDNQNGDNNGSSDRDEEDDFGAQVGEGSESETNEEDTDFAEHAERRHGLQAGDGDEDSEDDEQKDGGAYDQAIQIHLHRQNKVDLKISLPKGQSDDLEILVQNRQPRVRAMRGRRQG